MLVNRGTYGAPELAAAAIEDLKRGDVVGERTFGEGTVQKTIDLPDGAGLMLTVAKYEDPDGKKIQDDAVTPNVVVASPEDDGEPMPPSNGDEPLNQALSLLKAKNLGLIAWLFRSDLISQSVRCFPLLHGMVRAFRLRVCSLDRCNASLRVRFPAAPSAA